MEVNAEEGVVKYSKLIEDNSIEDNAKVDIAAAIILSQDAAINHPYVKDELQKVRSKTKVAFKTLVGLSLFLLMIVTGLVAGLFVMDKKIQRLNHQNQDLVQSN